MIKESDENYNGYTNYSTWRINLEIFDDGLGEYIINQELPDGITAEYVKEIAEDIVLGEIDEVSFAYSYAHAFMSECNWYEIAKHLNERKKEKENE